MRIYSAYLIIIGNLMALAGSMVLVYIRFGLKSDLNQHIPLTCTGIVFMIAGILIRNLGVKRRRMGM